MHRCLNILEQLKINLFKNYQNMEEKSAKLKASKILNIR